MPTATTEALATEALATATTSTMVHHRGHDLHTATATI